MKTIVAILALTFAGCSTTVYDRKTGKPILKTYANATLAYKDAGTSLEGTFDHSTPTRAAGAVAGTVASGATSIVTAAGAAGLFKKP